MTYLVICNNKTGLKKEVCILIAKELPEYASKEEFNLEELADPDIHILNGFGDDTLGIDSIKTFRKKLHKKPFKALVQLGIILGFENATPEAQNAMLKEFEDHAKNVIYILGVCEESNLLATIRSRATIIYAAGQSDRIEEVELQDLALKFLDLESEIVSQYAVITKKEWSREHAEQFLAQVYELSRQSGTNKKLLQLLQKSAEYLTNNVSPKQVLSHLLFSYRLKV